MGGTGGDGAGVRPITIGPVTLAAGLALFYAAQSALMPLTLALFTIALVWPLQAALQRRLPKLVALLITLSLALLVLVCVGSAVIWGFGKLAQWLFLNAGRYQVVYTEWVAWLEEQGITLVTPMVDRFDVNWLTRVVQDIASRLNSFTGFAFIVFILVMLGLLEVDDFNHRLQAAAAQPHGARILRANREIARKLRRFMIVRTFASMLTGLVVWSFALVAGLELAAAWGAIAFALNYIPFIGPLIATVLPTLLAIAQFDSWQMAVIVFVGLNVIQFIIGSYLEPLLTGASLALSPFAVVFTVFFWTFMWGLPGAFIGVPILIAFTVYISENPGSRWIAALLTGGRPADGPENGSG
jgi:predicted PurR-regulated permease PerM